MAELGTILIEPKTLVPGGTATVTVSVTPDPGELGQPVKITVEVDGKTGTGEILVGHRDPEVISFSTNPADVGDPGVCVVTADVGTLVYVGDSVFTYTAP